MTDANELVRGVARLALQQLLLAALFRCWGPALGRCGLVRVLSAAEGQRPVLLSPGEVLLGRAPHFVNRMYSALAGFVGGRAWIGLGDDTATSVDAATLKEVRTHGAAGPLHYARWLATEHPELTLDASGTIKGQAASASLHFSGVREEHFCPQYESSYDTGGGTWGWVEEPYTDDGGWRCFRDREGRVMSMRFDLASPTTDLTLVGALLGPAAILGINLDGDPYADDLIRNGLAFVGDAKREIAAIPIPVTWFLGRHDAWIDPKDPRRMIVGNDGGVDLSFDGGKTWFSPDLPLAQFYNIDVDDRVPWHVGGTMQDWGTAVGPNAVPANDGPTLTDWRVAGGGEAGDFKDNDSVNKVVSGLNTASSQLRSQASAFGSNLSIVQIRQDFSKNLINVLQTGSSNLTLADTNEEAANSQALSTRQSIAVSALALANQSQQSVLQLLR
ncbi:flagellin [uncultured Agitococcus sp.]|uniref:flagellin n=1 Tax=uncultured Agitococcus sp. TaxID=1506599 RepID=UPI00261C7083|nr:flagellin [uncultured Agitococcus sp.]